MTFLRALLLEADLLALVPAGFFATELTSGRMVRVKTDVPPAATRVGILRRNDDTAVTPVVTAFLEGLRRALRQRVRRK